MWVGGHWERFLGSVVGVNRVSRFLDDISFGVSCVLGESQGRPQGVLGGCLVFFLSFPGSPRGKMGVIRGIRGLQGDSKFKGSQEP